MPKSTQVLNDERHERHLLRLRGIAESKQEDARRLARYDEAIRLLRKWLKSGQYPVTETKAFLAAEPADKETT